MPYNHKMPVQQIYTAYDGKDHPVAGLFRYCPRCKAGLVIREIAHKPRAVCPNCGFIQFRNPAPTIAVLILHEEQVLLGKRSGEPGMGKWATPSGYIEYEDDFLTAAVREVREETGLEVEIESILNVSSSFMAPEYHFLDVYLLARVVSGAAMAGDDMEEVAWFPLAGPFPDLAFAEDADVLEAVSTSHFRGWAVNSPPRGMP